HIVIRPQGATEHCTTKPDANRMRRRIMKIRVHSVDLTDFDQQPRLFLELALGRLPHVLVIFYIPAGDAPGTPIHPTRAPCQHNVGVLQDDHGNPNRGILPENKLTRWTHRAFTPVQPMAYKGGPTAWTILIRPWHGRPFLLYGLLTDPFRMLHFALRRYE